MRVAWSDLEADGTIRRLGNQKVETIRFNLKRIVSRPWAPAFAEALEFHRAPMVLRAILATSGHMPG